MMMVMVMQHHIQNCPPHLMSLGRGGLERIAWLQQHEHPHAICGTWTFLRQGRLRLLLEVGFKLLRRALEGLRRHET